MVFTELGMDGLREGGGGGVGIEGKNPAHHSLIPIKESKVHDFKLLKGRGCTSTKKREENFDKSSYELLKEHSRLNNSVFTK